MNHTAEYRHFWVYAVVFLAAASLTGCSSAPCTGSRQAASLMGCGIAPFTHAPQKPHAFDAFWSGLTQSSYYWDPRCVGQPDPMCAGFHATEWRELGAECGDPFCGIELPMDSDYYGAEPIPIEFEPEPAENLPPPKRDPESPETNEPSETEPNDRLPLAKAGMWRPESQTLEQGTAVRTAHSTRPASRHAEEIDVEPIPIEFDPEPAESEPSDGVRLAKALMARKDLQPLELENEPGTAVRLAHSTTPASRHSEDNASELIPIEFDLQPAETRPAPERRPEIPETSEPPESEPSDGLPAAKARLERRDFQALELLEHDPGTAVRLAHSTRPASRHSEVDVSEPIPIEFDLEPSEIRPAPERRPELPETDEPSESQPSDGLPAAKARLERKDFQPFELSAHEPGTAVHLAHSTRPASRHSEDDGPELISIEFDLEPSEIQPAAERRPELPETDKPSESQPSDGLPLAKARKERKNCPPPTITSGERQSVRSFDAATDSLFGTPVVESIRSSDEGGRFNPATDSLFDPTRGGVANVAARATADNRYRHDPSRSGYRETGEPRVIGRGREVERNRADQTHQDTQENLNELLRFEVRFVDSSPPSPPQPQTPDDI